MEQNANTDFILYDFTISHCVKDSITSKIILITDIYLILLFSALTTLRG